ncbi:hypothetical protein HJG39_18980 [Alteromonas sp. a30]|nr:hypothetical protein [Alteromonas sp. a30]
MTVAFLSWIWSGIVWLWEALVSSYSISGWLLIIIAVLALMSLSRIFLSFKKGTEINSYETYIEDFLFGTKWRWRWGINEIINLWCFCPRCDAELVYDDSSCRRFSYESETKFICENCSRTVVTSIPGGNKDYALSAVGREIRRRIRTNEINKS